MKVTNLKHIAITRRDTFILDPRRITDIEGLNERTDYGDHAHGNFAELKENIRLHGVEQDLLVKVEGGRVGLIKGYRRMRAVRELIQEKRWTHPGVPVKPEPKSTTEAQRLLGQITDNIGKEYNIREQGRIFLRLEALGMKHKEIEQAACKSRTHVKNAMRLAAAPPDVLAEIEAGHISESLVIDLIIDCDGDYIQLASMVNKAIAKANAGGKEKASKKYVEASPHAAGANDSTHETGDAGEPLPSTLNTSPTVPAPSGGPEGGFSSVPTLQTPREQGAKGAENTTSLDATRNLEKLNKLMEEVERKDCQPQCYDTVEAIIAFLEGKLTVKEMKKFLKS